MQLWWQQFFVDFPDNKRTNFSCLNYFVAEVKFLIGRRAICELFSCMWHSHRNSKHRTVLHYAALNVTEQQIPRDNGHFSRKAVVGCARINFFQIQVWIHWRTVDNHSQQVSMLYILYTKKVQKRNGKQLTTNMCINNQSTA